MNINTVVTFETIAAILGEKYEKELKMLDKNALFEIKPSNEFQEFISEMKLPKVKQKESFKELSSLMDIDEVSTIGNMSFIECSIIPIQFFSSDNVEMSSEDNDFDVDDLLEIEPDMPTFYIVSFN